MKFSAFSPWCIFGLCLSCMCIGVRSSSALYDANAPTITMTLESTVAFGIAQDNRPSEDRNGNGRLDDGEDQNGNGITDDDSGIKSVELKGNVRNLELFVDDFTPGDLAPIVFFTVRLEDDTKSGSGLLLVTNGAGNTASFSLEFGIPTASAKGKGQGTNKSKRSASMSYKGISMTYKGKGAMMAVMMGKGTSTSSTSYKGGMVNGTGASTPSSSMSFKSKGFIAEAKGIMMKMMRMMGKGKDHE
eukprot:scaffold4860_cov171-Amphora_coffeaeformis.AAC.1